MNIKFLQDYSGRETAMKEYKKGDTALLDFHSAAELVRLGIAVPVEFEQPRKKEKVKHEPYTSEKS